MSRYLRQYVHSHGLEPCSSIVNRAVKWLLDSSIDSFTRSISSKKGVQVIHHLPQRCGIRMRIHLIGNRIATMPEEVLSKFQWVFHFYHKQGCNVVPQIMETHRGEPRLTQQRVELLSVFGSPRKYSPCTFPLIPPRRLTERITYRQRSSKLISCQRRAAISPCRRPVAKTRLIKHSSWCPPATFRRCCACSIVNVGFSLFF